MQNFPHLPRCLRWLTAIILIAMMLAIPTRHASAGSGGPTPAPQNQTVPPPVGHHSAVIDNGTVQLGVNNEGHLGICCYTPSAQTGTPWVGIRYLPTGNDFTAPGCVCEGWGAADATSGLTGYADVSVDGVQNLNLVSFSSTASTATSIVTINDGSGNPAIQVTHDFHPSPLTPYAYEATVTLKNVSAQAQDLRYRRVMDWDMEPTAFYERVTIDGSNPAPSALTYSSDNGFDTANPLGYKSQILNVGPPTGSYFYHSGPADHGAHFDFDLGTANPGESKTFTIIYGAAPNESAALNAVAMEGAEVWSLGLPGNPTTPDDGVPNTAFFGFKSVGGAPLAGSDDVPPIFLNVFAPGTVQAGSSFDVAARLFNPSSATATGTFTNIILGPGLSVSASDSAALGDLAPGASASQTWHVQAASSCTSYTTGIDVYASDTNVPPDNRHVHKDIQVQGTCGHVVGTVTSNGSTVSGAEVDACDASNTCTVVHTDSSGNYDSNGLPAGTYTVTCRPTASMTAAVPVMWLGVVVSDGTTTRRDCSIAAPVTFASGAGITPVVARGTVPTVFWGATETLTYSGCAGASVTYKVLMGGSTIRSGTLTEVSPGAYSGTISPTFYSDFSHGYATIVMSITCPGSSVITTSDDIYIDPSGVVRDTNGNPIQGATVTLMSAPTAAGSYTAVPNGDPAMSLANRNNPDTTDAGGNFGWDVVAGYYKIRAQKTGCVDPSNSSNAFVDSSVLTIPPPATGLVLTLQCDTAPPTTSATLSPSPNTFGWSSSGPVTVTLSAADNAGGSGVKKTYYAVNNSACTPTSLATCSTYSVPFTVSTSGSTITFFSIDNANNAEALNTRTVKIAACTTSGPKFPSYSVSGAVATVNQVDAQGFQTNVYTATNATVSTVPSPIPAGSTSTFQVKATKINTSTSASLKIVATDQAGCTGTFDPLMTGTLREEGKPQTDTYAGIDKSESEMAISNGTPGVNQLKIDVNGKTFNVNNLQDGQRNTLDIGPALVAGNNTITVTSLGKPGGNAVLMVGPPSK